MCFCLLCYPAGLIASAERFAKEKGPISAGYVYIIARVTSRPNKIDTPHEDIQPDTEIVRTPADVRLTSHRSTCGPEFHIQTSHDCFKYSNGLCRQFSLTTCDYRYCSV